MFFTSSLVIGPLSGELSLAQALEVNKEDREVAERGYHIDFPVSLPLAALPLSLYLSPFVCIILLGVGTHYPLDSAKSHFFFPLKKLGSTLCADTRCFWLVTACGPLAVNSIR